MSKPISQVIQNMENISNNTCVVCYKNVDIYSIGMCEHPVCYECSTRMRVLCRQNECPICRQDLPKVVFTQEIKPFRFLRKGNLLDTRYQIYFDNEEIQHKFYDLLVDTCTICSDKQMFNNFNSLKDHMRRVHELYYCDLCVENLKIFSRERRSYTKSELTQHRKKGDIDDKSHKGHPLCEFCDQRYMDNDELYRHLRRDHLYCHFCDADGLHQYYNSYDYLRDHFRQEHFLCEEGPCIEEKFTSVFRTDIDLKAHKTSVHGKQLSKAAAKQARTLELEFTLAPRGDNRNNRRGLAGSSGSRNGREMNNTRDNNREYQQPSEPTVPSNYFPSETDPVFVRQPSVDVQSTAQFPVLGNATPFVPPVNQTKGRGNVTIRSTVRQQPLAVTDENFPALGPEPSAAGISKTVNFSLTSGNKPGGNITQGQQSASNVSIQVNHEPNGMVTTRVSGPNIRIRPWMESDFPALGANNQAGSLSSSTNPVHWKESLQWTFSKSTPKPVATQSKKPVPPPIEAVPPAIASGEDFPTLRKFKHTTNTDNSESKKQSTLTVVPTWTQVQPSTSSNGTKNTTDITKGKTKKKKNKQTGNNNSTNTNGVTHTKSESFSSSEKTRETELSSHSLSHKTNTKNSSIQNTSRHEQATNKKDKKKGKSTTDENAKIENNWKADNLNTPSSSSTRAPRKRTELKIDSLNSTNNNGRHFEDFPALGSSSSVPPGFTIPPPGFNTATPPPPGFCIKLGNMEQLENSNGLTFTNSLGESYSILPDNCNNSDDYSYISPPDFQKRNKNLVAKVNEVLKQQEQIDDFRHVSGFFRRGNCSAEDFYQYCREVMGSTSFENVFPELLILLPDIKKQQELFKMHKKEFDGKLKNLELCATCGQVIKSGNDFRMHMSNHTLENHFPVLEKTTTSVNNAWARK